MYSSILLEQDLLNSMRIKTVKKSGFLTATKHLSSKLHVMAQTSRIEKWSGRTEQKCLQLSILHSVLICISPYFPFSVEDSNPF